MADKFEDLRTYVTVVSCGGINSAAAELGIAKSAVSRRISDLEARLGTVLIDRSTRRFEVTATGRNYYATASALLAKLQALDADPSALNVQSSVSLAAPPAIIRHLLAPAIAEFLDLRPGISIHLVEADEPADVIVGIGDELTGRHLANSRRLLCAAPTYLDASGPLGRTSDLPSHVGVMLVEQRGAWSLGGGATRSPRAVVTALDPDVALSLVVEGAGIAQLPDFVIRSALEAGTVVALLPAEEPAPNRVNVSVATDAGPLASALADHMTEKLAALRR